MAVVFLGCLFVLLILSKIEDAQARLSVSVRRLDLSVHMLRDSGMYFACMHPFTFTLTYSLITLCITRPLTKPPIYLASQLAIHPCLAVLCKHLYASWSAVYGPACC